MYHDQQRRQENGPKRIDVFERIETDTAEAPCWPRHISMRSFMERNGNEQGDGQVETT
jgi:hypothetical protein